MNTTSTSRTTKAGTLVRLVKGDSRGIRGTYENIAHHANKVEGLVEILVSAVEHIPFYNWIQGHNVHTLTTSDGRQYRFRPLNVGKGENLDGHYIGLEMFEVLKGGLRSSPMQITSPQEALIAAQLLAIYARPLHQQRHQPNVTERKAHGVPV